MDYIKNIAVIALIVGVLGAVGYTISRPSAAPQLGALTGPDIPYDHITVNNSPTYPIRLTMTAGQVTPCAIQSPVATSTLDRFAVSITGATTTATFVQFTKGATKSATTTALSGQLALAANAKGAFQASSSPEANFIISPSTWVQANVVGGFGTSNVTGSCTAVFKVI